MPNWSAVSSIATEKTFDDVDPTSDSPSYILVGVDGPIDQPGFFNWTLIEERGDLAGSVNLATGQFTPPNDMTVNICLKAEWEDNPIGTRRNVLISGFGGLRRQEFLTDMSLLEGGYGQSFSAIVTVKEGEFVNTFVNVSVPIGNTTKVSNCRLLIVKL